MDRNQWSPLVSCPDVCNPIHTVPQFMQRRDYLLSKFTPSWDEKKSDGKNNAKVRGRKDDFHGFLSKNSDKNSDSKDTDKTTKKNRTTKKRKTRLKRTAERTTMIAWWFKLLIVVIALPFLAVACCSAPIVQSWRYALHLCRVSWQWVLQKCGCLKVSTPYSLSKVECDMV